MKIFLVLTVALLSDLAMGDIDMCLMNKLTKSTPIKFRDFIITQKKNTSRKMSEQTGAMKIQLLDCSHMRYFWLSWGKSELSFGQGLKVGDGKLYTFKDKAVLAEKNHLFSYAVFNGFAEFENECGKIAD
ncbi:hypothetical protein CAPTEDRAFT_204793 [Capitella teleta]|uniref:Farnesoic acid O-methyl transferase domain-containing protein n=1 Tax=Capitella teleta TaxID=283909 RepID=R7UPU9_CAPTE|nr:hypothetical protein CAPTEDRAFT_204793 [Capitella teleta]|eukprot:ELU08539.1 hypothetical protein CAPTEDRAFT_204793 [Capitella teleta]